MVAAICRAGGIPDADAAMIADVLVTTDMRGIHSHGVVRLARYLDCIRAGGINPAAEPVILSESANSIMASANGGLGIPATIKVMKRLPLADGLELPVASEKKLARAAEMAGVPLQNSIR